MKNFSEITSRLWSKEISQEELLKIYKNKFVEQDIIEALENNYVSKNSNDCESIFYIAFTFNLFSKKSTAILGKFITATWHHQHEDIVSIFQELKDTNAISYIIKAINIKLDYWYDDGDAFIRKCLFAIAAINTAESEENIKILANDSNEIIKKYAIAHITGVGR